LHLIRALKEMKKAPSKGRVGALRRPEAAAQRPCRQRLTHYSIMLETL